MARVDFAAHSPSDIHACSTTLCRNIEFHFTHIDKGLARTLGFILTLDLADLFLSADFIDLGDERISQRRSEAEDEVDDSLLEWLASWVDVIESANLNYQLQGTLSHFRILVHAPLAGKLCHLFVVFANDHFEGSFGQFFT